MRFWFNFLILFVVLITNKFFLFNEEFLILISFISFCFLITQKLGYSINLRFSEKLVLLQTSFSFSLETILVKLKQKKKLNLKYINFSKFIYLLKKHYLLYSTVFLQKLIYYLNNKEKFFLTIKLNAFKDLEKDYLKLIILLLLKKINTLNLLIHFYSKTVKIKKFETIKFITKLILLKKI
uniref:ATP synthase F1 subunit 4 n=1 Tax=Periphykon beckeri TaxID=2006982 RepID=UPI0022FD5991|nr:ATP synthase F1 subunit 4 [Periphykon beckeri]WAX04138.1 ATP synthase F1 subunit 4 [Periphykon beckeri]